MDCGDYVIIVNADKIKVSGKQLDQKIYYHHSDYVGGMKETTLREKLNKKPEEVIELAVKGMLPKGLLEDRCIQSFSYTLDLITNMLHSSLRN